METGGVAVDAGSDEGRTSASTLQDQRNSARAGAVGMERFAEDLARSAADRPSKLQRLTPASDDGSDSTPRSEVPSAAQTPGSWLPPTHQIYGNDSLPESGYFSPKPMRYHAAHIPTSVVPSTEPSPTTSINASTTSVQNSPLELPRTPSEYTERPVVSRDLSNASTASTATVRASDYVSGPVTAQTVQRIQSQFPNQAYSALQSQRHAPPYPSHILRTRSSHPSQHPSHYSSHTAVVSSHAHGHGMSETGSKTVGNSPVSSPGLFAPRSSPIRNPYSEEGSYSSPYLHFTQRQMPKETHVADVDVDPVSGRKLVNQYEIIDELGRGVHGKVKLGRNLKTGQYVAIKIVDRYSKRKRLGKNGSHEDKIKKEIAILKKARHPNIVSLIEVIDDPGKKKVYIVLEHVEMGEVKWQAEAPREIALVEWRRLDREAHGIFDNEAEFLEDEHILREAQKRRQKKERRKLRDFHRLRLEGSQVRTWSFEHGGETDEDDLDSETASRVSTRTTDAGHSEQHGQVTANLLDPDVQATDFAANPVPDELSQPLAHSKWHEDSTPLSTQPHGHATNLSDQSQPSLIGALEGTMYGAYEPAIPRGRTPSIAGSAASMLDADKSDIPEQFRYVPRMTLTGTRAAFRDTVLGLEYLHYQGVIHRDIKPANLLQTKDHRIKISDFGVSYVGRSSVETTGEDQSESDAPDIDEAVELAKTVGTPAFYAPELCQTDCSTESYPVTGQIDVWALGVTLYCLIFGRVPFHDHNTFALMRLIAEEDVYIPRTRLKAVDEQSSSRPSSHGRMFQQTTSDRRLPHQLIYEEIDDDLYDLLKRLFVKDPSRRIKLTEVKHHPWVLRDIGDPYRWLDETDPSRLTQGKRIEVSKEDVAEAVVPLTMMERARSTARSTLRKIGGALGIGKSASVKRRDRAVSSATNVDGAPLSNGSSSSTLSQDAGRPAMKVDESIFSALKASREGEHPLSQSVTASPECKEHPQFFESAPLRPSSPGTTKSKHSRPTSASRPPRPGLPERAMSSLSTTGSVRTVKQADFLGNTPDLSSEPMPGLPGTPVALDTPTGSNLGGLFGGTGRKIMKSVSLRSRDRYAHDRTKSIDRLVASSDDAHAEPSIAFSTAVAAGMVETPNVLKGYPSTNSVRSPGSSRTPSVTTPEFLHPQQNLSRHSRPSSISSPSPSRPSTAAEHDHRSPSLQHNGGYFPYTGEPSDQQFDRAREENVRRRILEEDHVRSRPGSSHQRPQSALSQLACPPSPDDDLFYQKQKEQIASPQEEPTDTPSLEASPLTRPLGTPLMPMTSSSSEDQLFSGMSQSTSNPSIPSVVSANSSIVPEDGLHLDMHKEASNLSSDDTLHPASDRQDDSEGYAADNAVESCDDDDDESDEDFIVMTRKRSRKEGLTRSESISNAQLSRHRARRETTASIKTNRSGSSNTMRKVRSHSDPSDVDVLKLSRS